MGQRRPLYWDQDLDRLVYLRESGGWGVVGDKRSFRVMIGSGDDASRGLVPRPPTTTGSSLFLREDGTWSAPGGGGGSSDHATLTNLPWTSSGHTGTASRVAGFSGAGAATYYQIGADLQAYDAGLAALASFASTGIVVATAADTWAARTIAVSGTGLSISNGDGVAGNPTITISPTTLLGAVITTKGDLLTYSTTPDRLPVGSNGASLMPDSAASTGLAWVDAINPTFGDGSDGNVTYAANTTLAASVNAADLTINSGVRLIGGYNIRVKGTLTFTDSSSIISVNGANSTAAPAGAGFTGTTYGSGAQGGAGFSGATKGNAGTARTNSWGALSMNSATASDGGTGGASSGHSGGAGGAATEPTAGLASVSAFTYDTGSVMAPQTKLEGGGGGGAGGGESLGTSGGGGGGAGTQIVHAYKVTGGGIIEANGGTGGAAGGSGGSAGGGGGGGGGAAILVCRYLGSSAPTVRANGGTGGAGTAGGAAGNNGNNGFAETRRVA